MYKYLKIFFDLFFSVILIIILIPVFVLISLIIKVTSPGPIFYVQKRLGQNNTIFSLYKFRTMIHNSPDFRNSDGTTFNSKIDPRVTRFGRFLRESSLDELPQLFNVIFLKMSLVGPRPELPESIVTHTELEFFRLTVKPGITGYAQILGRNGIEIRKRRRLDVIYAKKSNFTLDLYIIFKTFSSILLKKGIYKS